jgi:uncharacterized protein (UPF0335 family)
MGIFDGIKDFFSPDKERPVTASDVLQRVREKYPQLNQLDDAKISSALSRKYPDQFGYMKDYHPDAAVPPAMVPRSMRTDSFYKAHPEEGTKEAISVIEKVKALNPKYKSVDAKVMADALAKKMPDLYGDLPKKLNPSAVDRSHEAEAASIPLIPSGVQINIKPTAAVPGAKVHGDRHPTAVRPQIVSVDFSKSGLPADAKPRVFKNGNEAYLAAEKANATTFVEYPNRHGKMIRRVLAPTSFETTPPDVPEHNIQRRADLVARGVAVSGAQIPQLGYGATALVADTAEKLFGSGGAASHVKDWALRGYERASKTISDVDGGEVKTVAESWEKAKKGDLNALGDWMSYWSGYGLGQAGESAAVGFAGAAIGSLVAPGPGTAAGAVEGVVAKEATKGFIRKALERLVEKRAAKYIATGVVESQAKRIVVQEIAQAAGAAASLAAFSTVQEGGSIYPDAVQKAIEDGRKLNGNDLGRIWGSTLVAAGAESLGDMFGLGFLSGKIKIPGGLGRAANAAIGGLGGAIAEGGTEAVQTGIERFGARREVFSDEGISQMIESAAAGALPGFGFGGLGGAFHGGKSAEISLPEKSSIPGAPDVRPGRPLLSQGTIDFMRELAAEAPTEEPSAKGERVIGGRKRGVVTPSALERFPSEDREQIKSIAESLAKLYMGEYNLARERYSLWQELVARGVAPNRDEMGEYKTLPLYMRKSEENGGMPIDIISQRIADEDIFAPIREQVRGGNRNDIYEALRSLEKPTRPSAHPDDYLDDAARVNEYNKGGDVQYQGIMPDKKPNPAAALSAFNKIISANKMTDKVFVELVDSIQVDQRAFEKGYGQSFQADKFEIKGATYSVKDGTAIKSLVRLAKGAHEGTGYHEAMHVVFGNVLTDQERGALLSKFGNEEATAEALATYEKHRTGREASTPIKVIFDKILAFIERIRNYFDGNGWRTAEDVLKAVSEGRTQAAQAKTRETQYQAESRDQTKTTEFKRWFGDSVVTDNGKPMSQGGKPLVVYHGTSEKGLRGNAFERSRLGSVTKAKSAKSGFFFVVDKDTAAGYSRLANEKPVADLIEKSQAAERAGKWDLANKLIAQAEKLEQTSQPKIKIIDAYLSIKKPYKFDAKGERFLDIEENIHSAIAEARNGGHDGIVIRNLIDNADWGSDRATDHWVAFEPTQIKSATGNSGTFDPNNPSILYQAETKSLVPQSIYDENRTAGKANPIADVNKILESAKEQLEQWLTPVSSVLADISPGLRVALRRQAYRENVSTAHDSESVHPFLEGAKKMKAGDYADLDLALKNGDSVKIESIVKSYALEKEYAAVRKTLDDIHARAESVGFDVGYLKDYWPRIIKDKSGFLEAIGKDAIWPEIQAVLNDEEVKKGAPLSQDEKVAVINTYLRGYRSGTIALAHTPNMKQREIEIITARLNKYYRDSSDAVLRYLSDVNHAIEARRFFGKHALGGRDLFIDNLDVSIGQYVSDLIQKGDVEAKDERRLTRILDSYFNQESMHGFLAGYKDFTTISTLGNLVSAVTQLQDLGTSVYRAPAQTLEAFGRALVGGSKIKMNDLGLEIVAEEFRDSRKSALMVSKFLRAAGLSKLDQITAETFINSVIRKYQKQAVNPNEEFLGRIRDSMGSETGATIEDLKSGELTERVKFLAFSEILGVQPKAMTELPETYLKGGNARIFYALKTFQLRQLDMFRQEIFKKMAQPGIRSKVIAMRRLSTMATVLLLAGIGTDELKDFMLGRKTTFSDRLADNILKLFGFSKWTIYKARQEGIGSAALKTILPPMPLVDQLWKDIRTAGDKKGLEVVNSIPLVGKFYYWWLGRGSIKKPLSDDIFWLKSNASRLGISSWTAYQAMSRMVRLSHEAETQKERDVAHEKALRIGARLAEYAKKNEGSLVRRKALRDDRRRRGKQ